MEYLKELGANLKAARKRAGLEQTDVAERLGVHEVTVSNWERGAKEPDEETIAKLAAIYRLPRAIVRYGSTSVEQFIARLQEFLAHEAQAAREDGGRPARARGGLAEPASTSAARGRRA